MVRSLEMRVSIALFTAVCVGLPFVAACGASGPELRVTAAVARGSYADAQHIYENNGRKPRVLRAFAESILLLDAQSPELARRHAAFNELAMLGTRARPLLEQLARLERQKRIRVQALALLWRLGDADARDAMQPLAQDPDPEVADVAFGALDAVTDRDQLLLALRGPRSARRLSAVQVFARVPAKQPAALLEVARLDPEPSVRAAALYALDPHAASTPAALERALHDESESVRIAALEAYARAAPDLALTHLDQQLGAALTRETLAAAATFLRLNPAREPTRARAVLARGLSAIEPSVRGYTAVLLRALPAVQADLDLLRARLTAEANPDVKLGLALALGAADPAARAALEALAQGNSLPAAQAAGELSRHGSTTARTRLLALRASPSQVTRAEVARELRAPELTAALLSDTDPRVRLAAAGAVLRGLSDA